MPWVSGGRNGLRHTSESMHRVQLHLNLRPYVPQDQHPGATTLVIHICYLGADPSGKQFFKHALRLHWLACRGQPGQQNNATPIHDVQQVGAAGARCCTLRPIDSENVVPHFCKQLSLCRCGARRAASVRYSVRTQSLLKRSSLGKASF